MDDNKTVSNIWAARWDDDTVKTFRTAIKGIAHIPPCDRSPVTNPCS